MKKIFFFYILSLALVYTANAGMVVGTYTGNGSASQAITGVGDGLEVLLVIPDDESEPFMVTASMPAGKAKLTTGTATGGNLLFLDDLVNSIDADGFTAGSDANASGETYYYVGWSEGSATQGTFTGSTGAQTINIGFQPEMVWTFTSSSTFHERIKMWITSYPAETLKFSNGNTSFGEKVFTGVSASGFDILGSTGTSSGVQDGQTYYYVAFASGESNSFGTSPDIGNGMGPTKITTTVEPAFIFARHSTTIGNNSFIKTSDMPSTDSFVPRANSKSTNGILSFESDGFNVGSDGQLRPQIEYFGFNTVAALPVNLIHFSATIQQNNQVSLLWKTASEINSSHFVVQRSIDGGQTFEDIGTVASAGNSTTLIEYTFIDIDPSNGNNYYRLKQVDIDGEYENYTIILVNTTAKQTASLLNIFPTPARDEVNFNVDANGSDTYTTSVYDVRGKLVRSYDQLIIEGTTTVTVNIADLSWGSYYIILQNNSNLYKRGKFIKR